ncbi:MAG: helix-turn-helix domain-containing protein [Methylomonas sp.]|jgi:DNA-binding transcriptional MerR regulator|uniref:helix-turn-helix domain-containing protein n=1 Tax=Methylomonas sp. TaxID=418 RepID=UPI0025F157BC|nr:helix-turn-helix domain-containing protein [Methylomonas sp.]MCK9609524.1 helix-turn-helix domain-containing protein [Methylomonas sp.]MDD2739455.1 helix-turn-helix domain-containing protein [Methylomonas lenta]
MTDTEAIDQTFTLDEICSLTETPKRTVRFYIQSGVMDRPIGQKRAAYYTQEHLEQLLFINKWQKSGLSLERIGELLRQQEEPADLLPKKKAGQIEVWSHLTIAHGIELQIEPSQAGLSSEQVRQLFKSVMSLYAQIKNLDGEKDER